LEDVVIKSDGEGLRARWESGRYMLTLRKGKQLPNGLRDLLAKELGIGGSELTDRMKFAEKYPSEQEVTDAIGKFKSWYAITQQALTDTPREALHDPRGVRGGRARRRIPDDSESASSRAPAGYAFSVVRKEAPSPSPIRRPVQRLEGGRLISDALSPLLSPCPFASAAIN
jgi:hypothetical protein